MKHFLILSAIAVALVACDGHPEAAGEAAQDSVKVPDSVPQVVCIGEKADWAYKPDTMISDLLLADEASLKEFKRVSGNEGEDQNSRLSEMVYVNTLESEQLTVYQVKEAGKTVAYGYRVKRNYRDKNSPPASNYSLERNFVTSAGIYIGEPAEYVQMVYKCQPMMRWVKGDTTYLSYAPAEKDKEHYKLYDVDDYHATYKFVDDKCVVMEVFIDLAAFAEQ